MSNRRHFVCTIFGLVWLLTSLITHNSFANLANTENYLLMVTSDACPWCEAFEDEVGVGYPLTNEGKNFPIKRIDYYQTMPTELKNIEPAIMTPTFIVIKNGSEVGRIVGYPGEELFWWRISEFISADFE